MRSQIIQIGNSQGVRIPKILLEETGLSGEVEIEAIENGISITKIKKPRSDWEKAFQKYADLDEQTSPLSSNETDFDGKEWKW